MGNVCECINNNKQQSKPVQAIKERSHKPQSANSSQQSSYNNVPNSPTPNKNSNAAPLMKPSDFQSVRYLGKGSFGSVAIVRKKNATNDKLYAMKLIKKEQIREKNLLQSEFIEKAIIFSRNAFLVDILYTFQNKNNIYIVMEYIEGGDLFYYMRHQKLSQQIIQQVAVQVIEALCFLHSKDIIYRDLKPENVLITTQGHIKITDFGLSRLQIEGQPTFTFAGNLQYMAPEVLEEGKGYDKSVDIWSLGILLYELKYSRSPFLSEDETETKRKITQQEFSVDGSCSSELESLIRMLLVKDPVKRPNLQQIRNHEFFKYVDWEKVRQRQNPTPLKSVMERVNIKYRSAETAPRLFINSSKDFSPSLHEFTYEEDTPLTLNLNLDK